MIADWRLLERVTRVAPFGFRLWDPVLQQPVSEGLRVAARPTAAHGSPRELSGGRSGTFAIRGLPLGDPFVGGEGDEAFWASPPGFAGAWSVEVDDPLGSFLPVRFDVAGVTRVGRVAQLACRLPPPPLTPGEAHPGADGQPARPLPLLPLFSSPARAVPPGIAVVIAHLERTDGRSAAGSVLEVSPPRARSAYGVADERGVVAVLLPYPEPQDGAGLSPIGPRRALTALAWEGVEVRAYAAAPLADPVSAPARPELCATLDLLDTPPATLLAAVAPRTPLTEIGIEYGRPAVLRTAGASTVLMDAS